MFASAKERRQSHDRADEEHHKPDGLTTPESVFGDARQWKLHRFTAWKAASCASSGASRLVAVAGVASITRLTCAPLGNGGEAPARANEQHLDWCRRLQAVGGPT